MQIGIGITANDRPQMLAECLQSIYKHTDMTNVTLYVADDTTDKKGVAFKKNECLRALKDCDYVFLFDDDIKIIKHGWEKFIINSGLPHAMFLNEKLHTKLKTENGVDTFKNCGGVMLFMTNECIKKVGAFNEDFGKYAFEHAEYSLRISIAYNIYHPYIQVTDTGSYFYSHDYSTYKHASSISDLEKHQAILKNWNKFHNEPIKDIYLPL